ncbi:4-coumarate--CoA ligase 3-like isoform X1 [Athalia rosae]|uniref:4-coumarate--CoA ligase 3-like isoform X1 n=1 Tax=Athalia rosae TaxID=37344 RepID=UPI00203421E5|nr:4-coumarate--CoA ligase 3-like isoform X1 [Athalia rosae]
MSNIFRILNRSVLKFGCWNVRPDFKFSINKRGMFFAANGNHRDELYVDTQKNAFLSTPSIQTKCQSNWYSTKTKLRVNEENIVSSPFEELEISQELLHEFVWKNINRWPNKTAVVCPITGKSYTYAQLRKLSGKFANSLRKLNLRPGSIISVILPNIVEFPIVVLGASEAGIKITTSNPVSTAKEIDRQLINSDACAIITIPELYTLAKQSISGNSNIKLPIILIDESINNSLPESTIRFSELVSDSVEMISESETSRDNSNEAIYLPYSSGTTGLPKGVELSHRNMIMNFKQLSTKGVYTGSETTETHQDVLPLILPAFHAYGMVVVLLNYLCRGAKILCLRKFTPEGMVKCLEAGSNLLYLAPPLVLFLGNSDLIASKHLERVNFVMSGAAPIGEESVRRFLNKANHEIIVAQGYGATETGPVVSTTDNGLDNLNAVGYVVSNTNLRIVGLDEQNVGKNLGVNEVGEIYVRGPQIMKGYHKNPVATAETMDGDWYKTGDIGCYDEIGHILVKDRLKELIKVKGFQVPPAELEELLRSNENILDAAVVGEQHPQFGELPKAFVVCKPGKRLDEDAVKKFIAERVPKYKRLGTVKFIDVIPKSAAGKILRRELKNM